MNIDLLFTGQDEAGLVFDTAFEGAVAGVMFDAQTGQITLELGDAEPFDLNIPVEAARAASLQHATSMQVGVILKGIITDSREVPIVQLNDPFGGGNAGYFAVKPRKSVMAFESFMARTVAGQPVHRDDLGNEAGMGSILGGLNPAILQFSPQLARQRTMEAAPHLGPATPAPMGPGGMGGGRAGGGAPRRVQQPPRRVADDEDEE